MARVGPLTTGGERERVPHTSGVSSERSGVSSERSGVSSKRVGLAANKAGLAVNPSGVSSEHSGVSSERAGLAVNGRLLFDALILSSKRPIIEAFYVVFSTLNYKMFKIIVKQI
jgi:hypothetical protein